MRNKNYSAWLALLTLTAAFFSAPAAAAVISPAACSTFTDSLSQIVIIDVGDIATPIASPLVPTGKCAKADFDGDGKLDFLVQGATSSDEMLLFRADANGKYTSIAQRWSNGYLGLNWTANQAKLFISDYNGDGRADIFVDASTSGGTSALLASSSNGMQETVVATWANYELIDNRTTVAGTTSGNFSVADMTGAGLYDIPIVVPPGIADVEPQLSLSYNSQGGNGLLGVGWSLGGLSSISRCGQAIEPDGQRTTIAFNQTDRFCLDGQRLMVKGTATYGSVGAEYRTEIESFQRVVSTGGSLGQPNYFVVTTKSGLKQFYGQSTNGRFTGAGTTSTMTWALTRVEDAVGNFMTFEYYNQPDNQENGQYYIERIEYTGNGAQEPTRLVLFEYEAGRPDKMISYVGGKKFSSQVRLSHVKTFIFEPTSGSYSQLVRDYVLEYETAPMTQRSRIKTIKECGPTQCLGALTMTWEDGSNVLKAMGAADVLRNGQPYVLFGTGDINGDGFSDLCYKSASTNAVSCEITWGSVSSAGPLSSPFYTAICANGDSATAGCMPETLQLVDVNSDGRSDVAYVSRLGASFEVHVFYTNSAYLSDHKSVSVPDYPSRMQFADVNGDSYQDICYYTSSDGVVCKLSTSTALAGGTRKASGQCKELAWGTDNPYKYDGCDLNSISFADLNADGKADLSFYTRGEADPSWVDSGASGPEPDRKNPRLRTFLSVGDTFDAGQFIDVCASGSGVGCYGSNFRTFADINGDGLLEVCFRHQTKGVGCLVNTGSASARFASTVWAAADGLCANNSSLYGACNDDDNLNTIQMVDINADGMTDITYRSDNDGIRYFRSTGAGFVPDRATGICSNAYKTSWDKPCSGATFSWADMNGDGRPDLRVFTTAYERWLALMSEGFADLIVTYEDAYNASTEITYLPMTNKEVYVRSSYRAAPYTNAISSQALVRSYMSGSVTPKAKVEFKYWDAAVNLAGRGWQGFAWVQEQNFASEKYSLRKYHQQTNAEDYWKTGLLYEEKVDGRRPSTSSGSLGTRIAKTTLTSNVWAKIDSDAGMDLPYLDVVTTTQYAADEDQTGGARALATAVTDITGIDAYGNVTNTTTTTTDHENGTTHVKTTENTYADTPSSWILGRLTRAIVKAKGPGAPGQPAFDIPRTVDFEYYGNGLLKAEIVEPTRAQFTKRTEYGYDRYGNKTQVTVSGAGQNGNGIATRTSYSTFHDGYFPNEVTNALGHTETTVYDARFGLPESTVGPNGIATFWDYDQFGRKIRETRADGTEASWTYANGGSTTEEKYNVTVTETGKPSATTYYSALGLDVRSTTSGADGSLVVQRKIYDAKLKPIAVSQPYFSTATPIWTCFKYDAALRVSEESVPHETSSASPCVQTSPAALRNFDYADRKTTTTVHNWYNNVDNQQVTSQVVDAFNRVIQATDAANNSIAYSYDPFDNLVETRDQWGEKVVIGYDDLGHRTSINDPDMGVWTYTYYVDDTLRQQTDAMKNIVLTTYDKLGRPLTRQDKRFISAGTYDTTTTTWTYDTVAYGIGKLASVTGPDYLQIPTYDRYGRPSVITTTIEGKSYATETGYDGAGRVDTTTYPDTGTGLTRLMVRNVYNTQGYLTEIRNASNNKLYWKRMATNAAGAITQDKLGDNTLTTRAYDKLFGRVEAITSGGGGVQNLAYAYDTVGNLRSRTDSKRTLTETFSNYDVMNRLKESTINGAGKNYDYAGNGNIIQKSDFGNTYLYGENGAGPHAATTIKNGSTVKASYLYDDNGRVTNRTVSGTSIQFDYTAFNQPATLRNPTVVTSFKYDANRSRMVQRVLSTTSGTKTYTYVDLSGTGQALYEQEATASSVIHKHFIFAPTGRVAEYDIQSTGSGNDETTKYFLKDHLGSIDVVRVYNGHIAGLDSSTNKVKDEYLSYDAFGQRRAVSTWVNSLTLVSAYSDRGFTDHEHLEDFGLIHMNGRIYDPLLGRFLSADPNVQSPKNTQSLNRFSYVMNNPLSATDPTGYFSFSKFMHKWMPIILQIGMMAASGGLTAFGQAAVAGFMGFAMSGGDVRAGLVAAATAGMFHAVGTAFGPAPQNYLLSGYHMGKILAHGIVGGISSKMGGGNFADGFRSAAVTQAFAPGIDGIGGDSNTEAYYNIGARAQRIAVAAIVGGTASAAGGGKFANGAVTGAFSRAFNDEAHYERLKRQYSRLTGEEKRYLAHHPGSARAIMNAASIAAAEAEKRYPGSLQDGKGDAFRHAYWNALITSNASAQVAEEFTTIHELSNHTDVTEPVPYAMDMHNNYQGRKIALRTSSAVLLAGAVDQALKDGRLLVTSDKEQLQWSR